MTCMSKYQSEFRSLRSTITALLKTTNNWCVNIDNGFISCIRFVDLKDHAILLRKLTNYGVDQNGLQWFESYFTNRSQRCYANGHLSSSKPITNGAPRSSIICPLLFLVCINDLPNCLNNGSPRMCADDTIINYSGSKLSELEQKTNNELSKLNKWLNANNLILNTAKTEFMITGFRERLQTQDGQETNVFVKGKQINRVKNTKSLGSNFDEYLSWNKHVYEISKKISAGKDVNSGGSGGHIPPLFGQRGIHI